METVEGENGESIRKPVKRPARQWYWRDGEGKVRFAVRVLNKRIELAKGKHDILVGEDKGLTDAWNPGILQIRYMVDLLKIDVKLHSIFHAGSYDPADFLGRLIDNKEWSYNAERAFFHASDYNYFATQFHVDMFMETLGIEGHHDKIVRSGFPFDYLIRDSSFAMSCTPLQTIVRRAPGGGVACLNCGARAHGIGTILVIVVERVSTK